MQTVNEDRFFIRLMTLRKIARLNVLLYHLAWTARHKGVGASIRLLLGRLGLGRRHNRPGCPQGKPSKDALARTLASLPWQPIFSLLVPTDEDLPRLQTTLDSIQAQIYAHHEIILLTAPENENSAWVTNLRGRYPLKVHAAIEGAVLDAVKGDYFAVIRPGDSLCVDALGQVAIVLNQGPAAWVYTDEEVCLPGGERRLPLLKPDWSPTLLLSTDYMAHGLFFQRELGARAGGLARNCDRASLYDLALRISELSSPAVHIPHILWTRAAATAEDPSTPQMAAALRSAMQRRGMAGRVTPVENRPGFLIARLHPSEDWYTSILIATHDHPEKLQKCLASIFTLTQSGHFEVILVDHDSQRLETRAVIDFWLAKEPERFRCLHYAGIFNFSKINNFAASQAKGNLLVLLNNDTEVVSPDWLAEMAGYAGLPATGAVGAVLEYPDGRIQHGGIVMGVEDLVVHAFKDLPSHDPGYMGRLLVPNNFLAVTGACLMVRAEIYHALGGLHEEFAVAGGDIDFCLRAIQNGLWNIVLPHVRLIHHESATRGFEDSYQKFSRLQQELELLRQHWPEFISYDPYYHPCLDGKGKFSVKA